MHQTGLVQVTVKFQNGHTPYEHWHGTKPDLSHLHEIGCRAFGLIQNSHNPKVFDQSIECVLIGYSQDSKAYCLFHHPSKKILVSYHVSFIESHQDTNPPRPHATLSSPPTTADPLTIPSVPPPSPMPGPRRSPHTPIPSEKSCAAQGIPYIPASRRSPHTVTITTVPNDNDPPPTSTSAAYNYNGDTDNTTPPPNVSFLFDAFVSSPETPPNLHFPDNPATYAKVMASIHATEWSQAL